ncbi:transglutaminaseTgpA domain-containing protein [Actinacidiphila sp. bgisy145]|uniref:transglutaminase family protein n=1 Tax=Actinacidiphila sp. bgisy145 TaxID=3413792 RepID=UPI003EBD3735
MSGRARLTVCAVVASMLAAAALLPLTDNSTWYGKALLLVLLQSAVGAGCRRVPLARPLTVLVQALVSLVALTAMFSSQQALGGLLPGPQALQQLGQVVQQGITDVSNYSIPAPVSPGIRLLLVGGVTVVALVVDAMAVTYTSAAPAGLPLLALYSVAAGLDSGSAAWLYFLLAAAGYLLLLLAEGRDRMSRWGRVFSSGPPPGSFGGSSPFAQSGSTPVRGARRIGVLALGIALVAPAALPSLGGGLLDTSGHGGGIGRGGGSVNLVAALQDNLNQPSNSEVLTYSTTAKPASGMYLRIAALDKFDGTQWVPSNLPTEALPAQLPRPQGMAADVKYTTATTRVRVDDSYVQDMLPLPFPATSVQTTGAWKYQPEGRMLVGTHGQTAAGQHYTVTSMEVDPTAQQLAQAPKATGRIAEQYEQVPDSLPAIVKQTALRETKGATNDYQRAVDLQNYFTSGQFVYNTQAKAGTGVDAIARFLQTKEGFCVHFAFTMAAMARTLHIPARVAIGFTPGSPTADADGLMTVGLKDAHAWPELYFEGIGWTRFEPTPYRGSAPDYTQTTTPSGTSGDQDVAPHTSAPATTDTPTPTQSCEPGTASDSSTCAQQALPASSGSGGGFGGGRAALVVLAALLVLLLPTTPLLWRSRLRRRRLGGGGDRTEGLALAAWREVVDTGWDYGIPPDGSETPRRAMARLVRDGRLTGEPAASAARLATAVEQTLYAADPRPATGLAGDVHRVHQGLKAGTNRRGRLRAAVLPRSAARIGWGLAARWTASTGRARAAGQRLAAPVRNLGGLLRGKAAREAP